MDSEDSDLNVHAKKCLEITNEIINIFHCLYCNTPLKDAQIITTCNHLICRECLIKSQFYCFCAHKGKRNPFPMAENLLREIYQLQYLLTQFHDAENKKNILKTNSQSIIESEEKECIESGRKVSLEEKMSIEERKVSKEEEKESIEEKKVSIEEEKSDLENESFVAIENKTEQEEPNEIKKLSKDDERLLKEKSSSNSSSPMLTPNSRKRKLKDSKFKCNSKGESLLHIAAIKNKFEELKNLIQVGEDINIRDYAGWTPLHEAVNNNSYESAKVLLEAGALVNVPGYNNNTALHDAVLGNRVELARLLLSYGADKDSRNIDGYPPIYFASSDEMIELFKMKINSPTPSSNLNISFQSFSYKKDILIFPINLTKTQTFELREFTDKFKCSISKQYRKEVTHILTASNIIPSSLLYLNALHSNKFIVDYKWIEKCLSEDRLIEDFLEFEVQGSSLYPTSYAPKKARLNAELKHPPLLNGCNIFLARGTSEFSWKSLCAIRSQVETLLRTSGANILKREPTTHILPEERTIPFHASKDINLSECSHYIIYQQGKIEPRIKYKMNHLKTLPFGWLIQCLENFELVYNPIKNE